jgi:hypothetical protein
MNQASKCPKNKEDVNHTRYGNQFFVKVIVVLSYCTTRLRDTTREIETLESYTCSFQAVNAPA